MELWTAEHGMTLLPALGAMLLFSFLLGRYLRKKDLRVRMIPLQVVACLLVALELGKQTLSLREGYDLYNLPFHFCSLFIFALPVMAFYRGRHQQTVYAVVSSLCGAVFLLMMLYPNLIYGAEAIRGFFKDYMDFHTVVFHNLVLLAFLLILALQVHAPQKKGERRALLVFTLCFCAVSATMAQVLKTNFNNFYSCNIPILEPVRTGLQPILGYGLTQGLYVAIVTVLDILFVQLSYSFYRLLRRITAGKIAPQEVSQ